MANRKKLGYTFYPKDWRTDDKVMMLNAEQRDAYRFIIDECFIKNTAYLEINWVYFRKNLGHNSQKLERIFKVLFNFSILIEEDDFLYVPSVSNRLDKTKESNGGTKSSRKGILNVQKKVTKEKENRIEREVKGKKTFTPPTLEEVIKYFQEKGYTEAHAKKVFEYYNELKWVDSKNNKIKSWKAKMLAVWLKEDGKQTQSKNGHFKDVPNY